MARKKCIHRFAAIYAALLTLCTATAVEKPSTGLGQRDNPWIVRETSDRVICREPDGREVSVRKHPQRVIVAYVSLIGAWYCVGGKVVAIPNTVNMDCVPSAAHRLDTIGRFNSPNLEKMVQLKPDLILFLDRVEKHHAAREIFENNRVDTLMLSYENYGDFVNLLDLFSRINGTTLKNNRTADGIVKAVTAVIRQTAGRTGPRFLCLQESIRGYTVDTNRAHVAYMATLLGGRNVITDVVAGPHGKRIKISMERIVQTDPDVIFIVSSTDISKVEGKMRQEFKSDAVWKELRAVKNGKVFFLSHRLFMYRPNEDFPEAFRQLAGLMYPDLEKKVVSCTK